MKDADHAGNGPFRVWIASYDRWPPQPDHDAGPTAVALEPAEENTMSAAEAAVYVEAFNREALRRGRNLRAVAVPVTVRYVGEPLPGTRLCDQIPHQEPVGAEKKPAIRLLGVDV